MFQSLRQGAPLFILYKNDEPRLEVGEVVSVGIPTPQFNANYQQSNQYMPAKNVIDIKVKINDQTIDLQKLPADNVIADFGNNGMVVATNKDSILSEIEAVRTNSQRIIDSVDKHKKNIDICTKLIEELNPALKQELERNKEIDTLKSEVSGMKTLLTELLTKLDKQNGVDGDQRNS